jgi:hypothetical protein
MWLQAPADAWAGDAADSGRVSAVVLPDGSCDLPIWSGTATIRPSSGTLELEHDFLSMTVSGRLLALDGGAVSEQGTLSWGFEGYWTEPGDP